MPRNNRKHTKEAVFRQVAPEQISVGEQPTPTPPAGIKVKALQDALVDGYENPAQWARDFLDVEPYPAQEAFLLKSRDCAETTLVAGNRAGKTHLSGVMLLWRAFYRYISPYLAPEKVSPHVTYKAVSTSLTHDQAKLAWNYALTFTESKRFRPFLQDVVHSPFPTMTLATRNEKGEKVKSEVWARSLAKGGVYLLGQSISFLLVDECAYVPKYPTIEDEVLRMRLADQGGSLFRVSTPNGRNHFFNAYQSGLTGDPRFYSQTITTWDNPHVSRAFIESMKERMVPEYYAQNVMGEFVSLSDFFKLEVIQGLY
ncbi:MAG TPA: terminase family protein, partial [Roseiflexaceae bacterium]|nr:terminase family protein [Roseiflexaceae bacterium]